VAFSSLEPWLRPYAEDLLYWANYYGLAPRVISVRRSNFQQARLYDAWISGRSSIPAAPPGRSLHNVGQAFDLKVPNAEDQQWLGEVWESWGGRWGGRFDDPNHFDTGETIA